MATETATLMDTATGIPMTSESSAALYRLLTWLSPAYPIGAFAYSQGLEAAIARGLVTDRTSTEDWLADSLTGGSLWSDAVIFARAYEAAQTSDDTTLAEINAFALAFQPALELRQETQALGNAFLRTTREAWPCATLDRLAAEVGESPAYPLAVASAAAGHGIPAEAALEAWLHAGISNLISAAIRLVPLGQSDGQRILAALEPRIAETATRAAATPLEALTTNTLMAEICAMTHETQQPRLFRS